MSVFPRVGAAAPLESDFKKELYRIYSTKPFDVDAQSIESVSITPDYRSIIITAQVRIDNNVQTLVDIQNVLSKTSRKIQFPGTFRFRKLLANGTKLVLSTDGPNTDGSSCNAYVHLIDLATFEVVTMTSGSENSLFEMDSQERSIYLTETSQKQAVTIHRLDVASGTVTDLKAYNSNAAWMQTSEASSFQKIPD